MKSILKILLTATVSVCALPLCAQTPEETPLVPNKAEISLDANTDSIIALQPLEDDDFSILGTDTIPVAIPFERFSEYNAWEEREVEFNPDPTRAVWLSALFPGLGQVYNRRYWKLPIVVGGFLGLAYATSWNNGMLKDYQKAYQDIMDNDATTNSYMNLFPPTTSESDIDKTWLTSILKSRKDYYRRNRDLCIISMVGVYFLAMVDAYVDASLSHFDISSDLSMDVTPAIIPDARTRYPSVGFSWAFNF